MAAAGTEPVVWVAVAGASACACGLVVGTTARVVPAVALAGMASAALVLAVDGYREPAPAEVRAFKAQAVSAPQAPAVTHVGEVEKPAPARQLPPPLTKPQFVHRFYAALEAGRFGQAWERLGPAVRARETSFEAWRAGYATTLSQRIEDLRVEADGTVRHTLVTVDRTPCGGATERRYEMLWYLDPDGRTFTARDVVGVQLAGLDPALACN
jgi:hypothetical protein